ncbi:ATP/GTP-binding protein [Gloeocapsa sp. PCC 73106]|uniref:GTP-binding protein n=1 Tax=Gloeocapsa sp. PCC 73106 TaxID=102232 RepID=UPI0002ACDD3A|nr:ATP/GTP-binding protein [Gloeocapsa sp. PCC 73106]ELR98469.1 putative GTPase [Gloeocapsa sp. PCC 73106]
MEIMRLVITGPVGAGKSAFIRSISEITPVDTDRKATDETKLMKENTTVAFDFGRLQFSPNMALHLYGTPGQSRFDFMWDILIRKAHAYLLLVSADQPGQFLNARRIVNFMNQRANIPMVIGLTHLDCPGAWPPDNVALALGFTEEATRPPLVMVNATKKGSVAQAIIVLVKQLLEQNCVV